MRGQMPPELYLPRPDRFGRSNVRDCRPRPDKAEIFLRTGASPLPSLKEPSRPQIYSRIDCRERFGKNTLGAGSFTPRAVRRFRCLHPDLRPNPCQWCWMPRKLKKLLGLTNVNYSETNHTLAIVDSTLS